MCVRMVNPKQRTIEKIDYLLSNATNKSKYNIYSLVIT
jgi:hypothetical protein